MAPKFKFTRDQIVEAGFDLVRRNGWSTLTTRSIAENLGASARPIYSYFASMEELEKDIVQKAVNMLFDYMVRKRTGDPWLDHGVGYVLFARDERHLFRSINDERHIGCFKEFGSAIWTTLTESLATYPPFQGLTEEQIYHVQLQRWLLAHGLAFSVSNPPPEAWTEEKILSVMHSGSQAIFEGLMHQFDKSNRLLQDGER